MTRGELICTRCGREGHVAASCPMPVPASAAQMVAVCVPVRIVSVMNEREHWSTRYRRAHNQREAARWALSKHKAPPVGTSVRIAIERVAPRELDDDNLAAGCKAVRDGVSDWLHVDDGSRSLSWSYKQRRGNKPRQYTCNVYVWWDA